MKLQYLCRCNQRLIHVEYNDGLGLVERSRRRGCRCGYLVNLVTILHISVLTAGWYFCWEPCNCIWIWFMSYNTWQEIVLVEYVWFEWPQASTSESTNSLFHCASFQISCSKQPSNVILTDSLTSMAQHPFITLRVIVRSSGCILWVVWGGKLIMLSG